MGRAVKNLNIWLSMVPADAEQGDSLFLSCFCSHTINKCPFRGKLSATIFAFLWGFFYDFTV